MGGPHRIWVKIATGKVEGRKRCLGVLWQPASTRLDQARLRLSGAGRATVPQYFGGTAQFARQYDQGAVYVNPWAGNFDCTGDAELRAGIDDAVNRRNERSGIDRDVAAVALFRLGSYTAVVEDDKLRIDRNIAAVSGLPLDRGGDVASEEIGQVANLEDDIAAAGRRRCGLGRDRAPIVQQQATGGDCDRAGIAAACRQSRNLCVVVQRGCPLDRYGDIPAWP